MVKQNEFVLSKQIVRSRTSIGANVEEAIAAQSRKDFISKMSIALKAAREINYWLRLMRDTKLVNVDSIDEPLRESEEIIRIITSIVKSSKARNFIRLFSAIKRPTAIIQNCSCSRKFSASSLRKIHATQL